MDKMKKSEMLKVPLTEEQKDNLRAEAQRLGLDMAPYARMKILEEGEA